MLGVYRTQIQSSTALGLVGAGVVQNAFFLVVAAAIAVGLIVLRPGLFSLTGGSLEDHAALALVATIVIVLVGWAALRHFQNTWVDAREGAAILTAPRAYATDVLLVEIASYTARIAVTATFMRAYHLRVTPSNVLVILAVNATASTLALTPGGVGTQQALATATLRNTASSSVVAAFSLGQQLILAAWDVAFGMLMLWSAIGWSATHALVQRRHRMPPITHPGG